MLKSALVGLALTGASCPPVVDQSAPAPKPACQGESVLIYGWEDPTPCDVVPPQKLVVRMDDAGPVQVSLCHDSGGWVLEDEDRTYCVGIDY